jgi:hypothetical protein
MTLRDVEVIELLADEPELLAIADAVAATEPPAFAPRRRRLAMRGAIVAAAAIAAVVVMLAAPQDHSGSVVGRAQAGILSRALAAIGSGQIMHVVSEGPAGTAFVDLKTGKRTPAVLREELWATRHGAFHLVDRVNGRVVGDLSPGDYVGTSEGPNSPAFIALWARYSTAALESKYARAELAGQGTVAGRSVYWIRFPLWYNDRPTRRAQTEVAVDSHTYKPVLERTYENGRRFDTRILLAEAIPYRPPELYRRLGPPLFNVASPGRPFGGHPFAGRRSRRIVPAPWLTAGKTVAGLRFLHVSRAFRYPLSQVATLPMEWRLIYRAVQLVYKPASHGVSWRLPTTTIDETFRPADPRPWKGLPPGSIEVQPGESFNKWGTHKLWTGYLLEHGVYTTISTPEGEHALLTIARSLRRVSN